MTQDSAEDLVWQTVNPDDIWVMDKLILSRKLGYNCGPVGQDVTNPGWYIVRPCVNMIGLGLGTQKVWLDETTMHLPIGHFWCEWFDGDHLSIDYYNKNQMLCVVGEKPDTTFTKWTRWRREEIRKPFPKVLEQLVHQK
jgi:hypothetical protein